MRFSAKDITCSDVFNVLWQVKRVMKNVRIVKFEPTS